MTPTRRAGPYGDQRVRQRLTQPPTRRCRRSCFGRVMIMGCTCGIPNRANYHTEVIVGRDVPGGTETTDVQVYTCAAHTDENNPRAMLRFDDADAWDVLESTTTHLRGES